MTPRPPVAPRRPRAGAYGRPGTSPARTTSGHEPHNPRRTNPATYAIVSNYAGKVIDHAAYAAKVRTMSEAELLYTIHDCQASLMAWPDCPSAGYYTDEIHYAAAELYRRRKGGQRDTRPVSDCGGFRLADDHDPDAIVLEGIDDVLDLA